MSDYKLSYFDVDGGRAEPIRIALHAAGINFEDHRVSFPEFAEMRKSTRFNAVPVLEINGQQITQSNAMARYIGKQGGLYPSDDLQALYCDEVLGAMEDLTNHMVKTFSMEGEALKSARAELVDGWIATFITGLEELLIRGGGNYFVNNQLSVADLKVYVQMEWLSTGQLDHIPTDVVNKISPKIEEHRQRIANENIVKAYYASRSA